MTISILLVDDSEIIRFLYAKSLERDADLRVVATASNGHEAIECARTHQPDVILLDIEMPEMDGLTALPLLRQVSPESRIFIISGMEKHYAGIAVQALAKGAVEFLVKPGAEGAQPSQEFHSELRSKIKAVIGHKRKVEAVRDTLRMQALLTPPETTSAARESLERKISLHRKPIATIPVALPPLSEEPETATPTLRPRTHHTIHALVIASSTGGPETLMHLFSALKGQLMHVPIFITQHMPPVFTAAFAEQLSRYAERPCKEAEHGEKVYAGIVYVAPGGHHLTLRARGGNVHVHLTQDAPVNSCRPSADPMFASASYAYGRGLLALVLTGIGHDGLQGARVVVDQGGVILAQDKATSIVYGMPRAVAEAGLCEAVLPLTSLSAEILGRCGKRGAR